MGELRHNVDADLAACQASLDEEATADAGARAKYGDEWRVPQSATLAKHLWEKLHSYRCVFRAMSLFGVLHVGVNVRVATSARGSVNSV